MTVAGSALPVELVPGLVWLGDCWEVPWRGTTIHSSNSAYLLEGDRYALLVDGGHPKDVRTLGSQLAQRLAATELELRYVFTTHQETPHSAAVGRVLDRYPSAELVGDVRDYHFIFPRHANRLRQLDVGASLDLGGTQFVVVEATIKDLSSTLWGFDLRRRVLFPGDGFAFAHFHDADMCGHWTDEVQDLPVAEMTARFSENALYWTTMVVMDQFVAQLDRQLEDLGAQIVAPTHGLPIRDLEAVMPAIREGLRAGGKTA